MLACAACKAAMCFFLLHPQRSVPAGNRGRTGPRQPRPEPPVTTGQEVTGKVVRLEKWAAFVDVGNNFTALLHIDEIVKPAGNPDATADVIYKLDDEIKVSSLGSPAAERYPDTAAPLGWGPLEMGSTSSVWEAGCTPSCCRYKSMVSASVAKKV